MKAKAKALTKRVIEKARENARLTQSGRVIVLTQEYHKVIDYPDTPNAEKRGRVLARVSWDGEVERVKGGK